MRRPRAGRESEWDNGGNRDARRARAHRGSGWRTRRGQCGEPPAEAAVDATMANASTINTRRINDPLRVPGAVECPSTRHKLQGSQCSARDCREGSAPAESGVPAKRRNRFALGDSVMRVLSSGNVRHRTVAAAPHLPLMRRSCGRRADPGVRVAEALDASRTSAPRLGATGFCARLGAPFVEPYGRALAERDLRHALARAHVDAQLPVRGSCATQEEVAAAVDVSVRPGAERRVARRSSASVDPIRIPLPVTAPFRKKTAPSRPRGMKIASPRSPAARYSRYRTSAAPHSWAAGPRPTRPTPLGRSCRDALRPHRPALPAQAS